MVPTRGSPFPPIRRESQSKVDLGNLRGRPKREAPGRSGHSDLTRVRTGRISSPEGDSTAGAHANFHCKASRSAYLPVCMRAPFGARHTDHFPILVGRQGCAHGHGSCVHREHFNGGHSGSAWIALQRRTHSEPNPRGSHRTISLCDQRTIDRHYGVIHRSNEWSAHRDARLAISNRCPACYSRGGSIRTVSLRLSRRTLYWAQAKNFCTNT